MKSFSIIGCGAVGKTVGRLFYEAGILEPRDILTRSLPSAKDAAAFIGAGRATASWQELREADLYLVAASDDAIATCAKSLAESGAVQPGAVVCHLSGALSSAVLEPVARLGAAVASVHPVKSFAHPNLCVMDFAGTWCGIEGDPAAVDFLSGAFRAIGGELFTLDPRFKTIYHAGSVLVCNYLTALIEAGAKAYQKGGVPREQAFQVMEPLVRATVENVFRTGTVQALTGPIARGDAAVVSAQLEALEAWDGEMARLYRDLAVVALDLSRRRGQASDSGLEALARLLDKEQE
ncbi:protein of unknown function DUF2520 [Citrifermentans bemidjiense Bem]|uniref:DUF2520 domain-containing protein n=1 Tax=Citrifermentans bemidjiense (strain ATCC BAA-1014 / DSM 16622 / JCM 12645 / Bem) TaxID=404380 RepID=B5E8Z5_CITBB|nr:Rossmann-like and DUF2520 domain-containing protein [Citrifermentans bemidjiense]ACH40159.1 protein of unknown function DUF2520 [Citrifermentans bemidjiense Bem]